MSGIQADFRDKHFVFLIGHIAQFGGAERQALILARLLRDRVGARVTFLGWHRKPGLFVDALAADNFPVHTYPLDWIVRKGGRYSRLARFFRLAGFARFIKREVKPDYLLPYVGENSKIAALIWRKAGARYTWWNQRDEGRLIYGSRLEKWLLKRIPDVVSNSFEGRDFLVSTLDVPADRIRVINNAVLIPGDIDGREWRNRLGLAEGDKLVIMVANLTQYKDHETLLKGFALARELSENGNHYNLALAGRLDKTAERLKAIAFDLGLGGSIHFLGAVADIDPLYAAADLVAHSSMKEGCPNAVLEGMAHGRCVVGTDISGLRQALGDQMAPTVLAPAKDAQALGALIRRWLEDDKARAVAGAQNRQRIQNEFSPERLLDSVLGGISERQLN